MMTMTVTEVIKFIIRSHVETVKTKITVEIIDKIVVGVTDQITNKLMFNYFLKSQVEEKGMFTN